MRWIARFTFGVDEKPSYLQEMGKAFFNLMKILITIPNPVTYLVRYNSNGTPI